MIESESPLEVAAALAGIVNPAIEVEPCSPQSDPGDETDSYEPGSEQDQKRIEAAKLLPESKPDYSRIVQRVYYCNPEYQPNATTNAGGPGCIET